MKQRLIRFAILLLAAGLVAVLTGCATTIQTVKVPVPVECKETVPARPVMPTEEIKAKPTVDELLQKQEAEILRREGYEVELRTALEACTAPIQPR